MQNDMRDRLVELLQDTLHEWECDVQSETVSQIAEHLIENGVIVPPCNVGETVYFIPKYITDWIYDDVEYIKITKDSFIIKTVADWYFDEEDFGKTVFLTKEQAEQKLKEMRDKNGKL